MYRHGASQLSTKKSIIVVGYVVFLQQKAGWLVGSYVCIYDFAGGHSMLITLTPHTHFTLMYSFIFLKPSLCAGFMYFVWNKK